MGSSGMLERSTYTWLGISVHLFLRIFIYDIVPSDPFVFDRFRVYDDVSLFTPVDNIFSYPFTTNYI